VNVLDIKTLCKDYGLDFAEEGHHHCHQGWIQVHCPWCAGSVSGYHLGFNIERGNMNCWRCGGHSAWDYVGMILHTTRKDLIAQVVKKYGGERQRQKPKVVKRRQLLGKPPNTVRMWIPHKNYLRGRKFNPKHLEGKWNLQGTRHLSGAWNWRIIIPVHNREGVITAYQGRTIKKGVKPKYKFTKDEDMLQDPKSLLYGIDKIKGDTVIIVEGVPTVWRIGFGAVAVFGIDWQEQQADILRRFKRRFVLFDPERQAQKRARQLAEWLSFYPGETEIITGLEHDPDKMTRKEVKELRAMIGLE
jgi:hypothetical protein